jgi:hypothetical protein
MVDNVPPLRKTTTADARGRRRVVCEPPHRRYGDGGCPCWCLPALPSSEEDQDAIATLVQKFTTAYAKDAAKMATLFSGGG